MNERKDILERVKHLMKENSEIKVNCSKLARQLNCDRRTVSRYIDITRSGKEASQREYPKKTDGFEHIIEEKVKTTAPAIAIENHLQSRERKVAYRLAPQPRLARWLV